MRHVVITTKQRVMEEYWVIRGVFLTKEGKKVLKEKEFKRPPNIDEIAEFLNKSGADFASVEHNFRFADSELTFE